VTKLKLPFDLGKLFPRQLFGAIGLGAKDAPPPPSITLIFFILDWDRAPLVIKAFEEKHVRFHFQVKAQGTASQEVLSMLGVGASDKAVLLCVRREELTRELILEARRRISAKSAGGIAFTVPLSGINSPLLKVFLNEITGGAAMAEENNETAGSSEPEEHKHHHHEAEGEQHNQASEHSQDAKHPVKPAIRNDLILAVINPGYSDALMTAAREAGAQGGTVISALGHSHEGSVKVFGASVQAEKEIVLILTSREKQAPIMEAVSKACGLTTEAKGLIFSLPVDNVMNLNFA
jgi:nitrogen regulatory protein PII